MNLSKNETIDSIIDIMEKLSLKKVANFLNKDSTLVVCSALQTIDNIKSIKKYNYHKDPVQLIEGFVDDLKKKEYSAESVLLMYNIYLNLKEKSKTEKNIKLNREVIQNYEAGNYLN
ncbi:hypothetical protein GF361_05575 [Candidatus Woesearchaeota archaeon]|nr:hypothetical protein [Candidatus Woesearchaeota archaeon]